MDITRESTGQIIPNVGRSEAATSRLRAYQSLAAGEAIEYTF
jgi:hypothetical protein